MTRYFVTPARDPARDDIYGRTSQDPNAWLSWPTPEYGWHIVEAEGAQAAAKQFAEMCTGQAWPMRILVVEPSAVLPMRRYLVRQEYVAAEVQGGA